MVSVSTGCTLPIFVIGSNDLGIFRKFTRVDPAGGCVPVNFSHKTPQHCKIDNEPGLRDFQMNTAAGEASDA